MCKSWKSELMQKLLVRSQMSYFAWLAIKQSSPSPLHNNTTSVWCLSWAHLRIAATSRLHPSTGRGKVTHTALHCDILHANIVSIQEHQVLITYYILCKYKGNNERKQYAKKSEEHFSECWGKGDVTDGICKDCHRKVKSFRVHVTLCDAHSAISCWKILQKIAAHKSETWRSTVPLHF